MPRNLLPEVAGVMTRSDVAQTIDAIAAVQRPNGDIPWSPGNHTDPWNHVEAAMALDLGSRFADAERAYEWLEQMPTRPHECLVVETCWEQRSEGLNHCANVERR